MAFLAETKKQIQATKNTQKITQAMQLVAANKMKTFQKRAVAARTYAWSLVEALRMAGGSVSELTYAQTPLEADKRVFVFITSDKGLCGSLNLRMIDTLFSSAAWKETPFNKRILFTIGRKGYETALRLGYPVERHFSEITEKTDSFEALQVIDSILELWNRSDVREVFLVSTHYVNPFTTIPNIKQYLPFSPEMIADQLRWKEYGLKTPSAKKPEALDQEIIFEPDTERVIEVLARQLAHMLFLQGFIEFKASEYSSRMVAMKKATEAADEVVKSLTLLYNKGRQAAITQQLCELAAGSAAVEVAT